MSAISSHQNELIHSINEIEELQKPHLSPKILSPASTSLILIPCLNPSYGGPGSGHIDGVTVVVALIFSTIFSAVITVYRGIETKANYKHIIEVKNKIDNQETPGPVKDAYTAALPFLKRIYINSCFKTALAATLTTGLTVLTATAFMTALAGSSYLVSPKLLALIGASITGAALVGFAAKNMTIYCLSFTEKRKKEVTSLYTLLDGALKEG